MPRNSITIESDRQPSMSVANGHWMPAADLFVGDRMAAISAVLIMAGNSDRSPGPASDESRPLYQGRDKGPVVNIGLRLTGLALLGIAGVAIYWLFGSVHSGGLHAAKPIEYLLAFVSFASASAGGVLLSFGTHIFDEVEVSERWKPRE